MSADAGEDDKHMAVLKEPASFGVAGGGGGGPGDLSQYKICDGFTQFQISLSTDPHHPGVALRIHTTWIGGIPK